MECGRNVANGVSCGRGLMSALRHMALLALVMFCPAVHGGAQKADSLPELKASVQRLNQIYLEQVHQCADEFARLATAQDIPAEAERLSNYAKEFLRLNKPGSDTAVRKGMLFEKIDELDRAYGEKLGQLKGNSAATADLDPSLLKNLESVMALILEERGALGALRTNAQLERRRMVIFQQFCEQVGPVYNQLREIDEPMAREKIRVAVEEKSRSAQVSALANQRVESNAEETVLPDKAASQPAVQAPAQRVSESSESDTDLGFWAICGALLKLLGALPILLLSVAWPFIVWKFWRRLADKRRRTQSSAVPPLLPTPPPAALPVSSVDSRVDPEALQVVQDASETVPVIDSCTVEDSAAMEKLRVVLLRVLQLRCSVVEAATATEKSGGPQEGQPWIVPELNLEMVPIRPGTFVMGASNNAHQVTLTKLFWLGRTEVTQGQWEALIGDNPSAFKGADRPVEQVSWIEAMRFCRKLTKRERVAGRLPEGFEYTLPTEAEWEYASRAGTTEDYAGDLDSIGWYDQNSAAETQPVAQKQPNDWGLFDMHGNVSEWCWDCHGYYPSGSCTDPMGSDASSTRINRGGCWSDIALKCRSAARDWDKPNSRFNGLGFRLALRPSTSPDLKPDE